MVETQTHTEHLLLAGDIADLGNRYCAAGMYRAASYAYRVAWDLMQPTIEAGLDKQGTLVASQQKIQQALDAIDGDEASI